MDHINSTYEPVYPPLDRAEFLIEHACVPGCVPRYCAESAQLFAALAECLRQKHPRDSPDNK